MRDDSGVAGEVRVVGVPKVHAINKYQLRLDVQHFLWPVYLFIYTGTLSCILGCNYVSMYLCIYVCMYCIVPSKHPPPTFNSFVVFCSTIQPSPLSGWSRQSTDEPTMQVDSAPWLPTSHSGWALARGRDS